MHFNDKGNSANTFSYPSNSRKPERTLSSPDLGMWGTLTIRLGVFLYSNISADFKYVKSWSTVAFDTVSVRISRYCSKCRVSSLDAFTGPKKGRILASPLDRGKILVMPFSAALGAVRARGSRWRVRCRTADSFRNRFRFPELGPQRAPRFVRDTP